MRYSIFGFNQEKILSIRKIVRKKDKDVEVKLDVTDLLILNDVADFMNRSKVIKHTIEDKIYFSMQYQTILDDLPILNIQKQALTDRIDKMSILGLLEKKVIKNQYGTFIAFRLCEQYEDLLYSCTSSQLPPTSSQLPPRQYSTTNHNINITNEYIHIEKEKEDKSSLKKKKFDVREDLSYVESNFIEVWKEWLDYKDEIQKQYKTQRGAKSQYQSLIKYANNNPVLANAIVKISIEHSWDGLFALTDKQRELFLSPKSPYTAKNEAQQPKKEEVVFNGQIYR